MHSLANRFKVYLIRFRSVAIATRIDIKCKEKVEGRPQLSRPIGALYELTREVVEMIHHFFSLTKILDSSTINRAKP